MGREYVVEKEWMTSSGHRAVVLLVGDGSHRCGYVGLTEGHPLFGKEYSYHLEKSEWEKLEARKEPFRGSPMDLMIAAFNRQENCGPQVSYFFDVHGGITYSRGGGKYPVEGPEWWFGFDCAHLGDATSYMKEGVRRSLAYCESECESFSRQLKEFEKASTP